jgi:hypothetical protein
MRSNHNTTAKSITQVNNNINKKDPKLYGFEVE